MLSSSFVFALRSAALMTIAASLAVACSREEEVAPLEEWPSGCGAICPDPETSCENDMTCYFSESCCSGGMDCFDGRWATFYNEQSPFCRDYDATDASDADFEEEVAPLEEWPSGRCDICPLDETTACADGNVCSDNPSCCGRGLYCSNGEWFEEYNHCGVYGDSDANGLGDADFSDSSTPAECPAGPQAPLDLPCDQEGLQCAYGYDPPECGGRTVICQGGVWIEESHSDPQPSCLDAGMAPD